MSLESALDEERREVMALLEGRSISKPSAPRNASPAAPRSPVRSMLDIGEPSTAHTRHTSISAPVVSSPLASPPGYATGIPIRSMMTTASPPATPRSPTAKLSGSPADRRGGSKLNPEQAYQFEMLPTIEAHSMPKRVTQGEGIRASIGGKKQNRAMSSVYGGTSGDLLGPPKSSRGRHNSTAGILGKQQSKSPSSRLPSGRSQSPGSMLNTNSFNLMSTPGKFVSESGKVIDMSSAYRRLSDAALVRSGGSLSTLPARKGSDPTKGESTAPDGGVRLEKDYYGDDDEDAVESSDEDDSSEGEGWSSEKRGRRRSRAKDDEPEDDSGRRKPKSLLAAAEDESRNRQFPCSD